MDKEPKASQSRGGGYRVTAPLVLATSEASAGVEALTLFVSELPENVIVGTVR